MPAKPKSVMAVLPDPETVDPVQLLRGYISGETDLICVLGPTASGKTKYAVELARDINAIAQLGLLEGCPSRMTEALCPVEGAEIISADSRQVFRGMDIGTGKDLDEYGEIPYHLIDVLPAGEPFNVFRYQQLFLEAYQDIRSRNCVPILCGGTGLYINAVCNGYDFRTRKPLSQPFPTECQHPSGESGQPLSGQPCQPAAQAAESQLGDQADAGMRTVIENCPKRTFFIGTLVSREVRNERIDRRLDARLQEGMVEEIKGLLDSGVPAETLIGYGLEYKYVTLYLLGQLTYGEMRERLATAIHQFAKRQMTWFRGMERSGVRIHWVQV